MMHTDKKNLGPSAIIGLGDYQGGKLWGCASPLPSRPSAPAAPLPLPPICSCRQSAGKPPARRSKGPSRVPHEFRAWGL